MEVRVEFVKFETSKLQPKSLAVLQKVGWLGFLSKFHGYNEEVTRDFSHSFDGDNANIGNLTIHIFEYKPTQVTSLPQSRERWLKNRQLEEKSWTSFLNKSKPKPNWTRVIPSSWLK